MYKFRRAQIITAIIMFLITVPILVFTIINNFTTMGDIVIFLNYWIWYPVIFLMLPVSALAIIFAFAYYSPMTHFSIARYKGAVGLMVTTYILIACLWVYCLGVVWVWNLGYTVLGLCFGYLGVIPFAVLASLMSGHVVFLIPIAFYAVCIIKAWKKMNNALYQLDNPENGDPGRM